MQRKSLIFVLLLGFAFLAIHGEVMAQDKYPDHEILTVVATSSGGSVDRMARAVQRFLPEVLNVSNIVENRKGAGGKIALNYFFKKPADGYTILAWHQPGITFYSKRNPKGFKIDDFAFINFNWVDPTILVAHKNTGWKSLEDMIQAVKQNPGKYSFGTASLNAAGAVFPKLLFAKLGLDVRIVPYTSSEAKAALMGGHVDMTGGGSAGMLTVEDYVVPLGVFWKGAVASWPKAKTVNEQIAKYNVKMPNGGSFRLFATHKKFKEEQPENFKVLEAAFKKLVTEHKGFQEYCDKGSIGREWQGSEEATQMAYEIDEVFAEIELK